LDTNTRNFKNETGRQGHTLKNKSTPLRKKTDGTLKSKKTDTAYRRKKKKGDLAARHRWREEKENQKCGDSEGR